MLPIIKEECILYNIDAKSKEEVLKQMTDTFDREGYLEDKNQFYKDVIAREKVFPTYIDFGIGLPHGKSVGVKNAGMCVARLNKEVIWDQKTGEKADFIVMIAVKEHSDNQLHLKVLSQLSRLLMHEEFRSRLKKGTAKGIYQTLMSNLEVN